MKFESNAFAAPLAGFTDLPWRMIAREFGAGIVWSEMISVASVVYNNKAWPSLAMNNDLARPYALQIFGFEPSHFSGALEKIGDVSFDVLDINMGCPVKKVVSNGAGSALMKDPQLAAKIIRTVRSAYNGPLTVKIRSGWNKECINAVEIAKIAEEEGADAVIVHPRTRSEMFTGHADWKIIADVKSILRIPVIGNGDIKDRESAVRMFKETGCDAIMIGRKATCRPWIFRELIDESFSMKTADIFKLIWRQVELSEKYYGDFIALTVLKKFVPKYLKGTRGIKQISHAINLEHDLENAKSHLAQAEASADLP